MAEKNMIKEYIGSSADKRVDIIMKNYTRFMGIVDGYIDGLRYMIEAEKDSNSRQNIGELGVRVQTGGMTSDPTAKHAIRNVMTRDALINCDFSGDVLDGVDHPEAYMKDSSVVKMIMNLYKQDRLNAWATFRLSLHSLHFQKIKYFVFLKATSCIYY